MTASYVLAAERLRVPESIEGASRALFERGWTDGLPIVPPTEDRVRAMLTYTDRSPDESLGEVGPAWGQATIESIAVNAVMAGCLPEYMPVLIAAVQAMLQPQFNLTGVQTTTHSCGVFTLVNGPLARELKINGKAGALGPGCVANATIGRATRFILLNIGGATPGTVDKATYGQPAKYTFCTAENEDENPWGPYHVGKGFPSQTSTVTVFAGEGPHNISDHVSSTAEGVLQTVCHSMTVLGANQVHVRDTDCFLCLGPEHANMIAREGFSKRDVQRYVYENARIPLYRLKLGGQWGLLPQPRWLSSVDDHSLQPIVQAPEDIHVIVLGGAGRHSCWLPTWAVTRSAIQPITRKDGTPVQSTADLKW